MISSRKYLPVSSQIFYSPLIKENLRLEFFSSDYKLNDLSLLLALMLRDGRTTDEIIAVTELPRSIIESVLKVLIGQGLLDAQNIYKLPENTKKILELSDCINFFNVNEPPIFSDLLTNVPVILPKSFALKNVGDEKICAAVVKNCEEIATANFEDISSFVKNFLSGHGAGDFLDKLKVIRLKQRAEVLFASRELRFLPVVGKYDLKGCVNIDLARTLNAELPVRRFKLNDGREFNFDLLLGTIFWADDDEQDSFEEILLSFKPNPIYLSDELPKKFFNDDFRGGIEDKGICYVKILVAEKVVGDFLCE